MEGSLDCPWSLFEPGTLQFCERQLCGWIVSPAETWSNLPYIVIGVLLWIHGARRHDIQARIFGFAAAMVGVFSFLYHMSHIWWLETLDLGSMLFLGIYLLRENLVRAGWLSRTHQSKVDIGVGAAGILLLLVLDGPDRLMVFGSIITVALYYELLIWVQQRRLKRQQKQIKMIDYRFFIVSIALFAASYLFWILDYTKLWCDTQTHLWSGHAIWHVLNSFCFWTLYRFYRQFDNFR